MTVWCGVCAHTKLILKELSTEYYKYFTRNKILHKGVLLRAYGYCTDTAQILLGYSTQISQLQAYLLDTARILHTLNRVTVQPPAISFSFNCCL